MAAAAAAAAWAAMEIAVDANIAAHKAGHYAAVSKDMAAKAAGQATAVAEAAAIEARTNAAVSAANAGTAKTTGALLKANAMWNKRVREAAKPAVIAAAEAKFEAAKIEAEAAFAVSDTAAKTAMAEMRTSLNAFSPAGRIAGIAGAPKLTEATAEAAAGVKNEAGNRKRKNVMTRPILQAASAEAAARTGIMTRPMFQAAVVDALARAAADGQLFWQKWLDEEEGGGWTLCELDLVLHGLLVPPDNVWEHLLQTETGGEVWIAMMKKEGCTAVKSRLAEWETRRAAATAGVSDV